MLSFFTVYKLRRFSVGFCAGNWQNQAQTYLWFAQLLMNQSHTDYTVLAFFKSLKNLFTLNGFFFVELLCLKIKQGGNHLEVVFYPMVNFFYAGFFLFFQGFFNYFAPGDIMDPALKSSPFSGAVRNLPNSFPYPPYFPSFLRTRYSVSSDTSGFDAAYSAFLWATGKPLGIIISAHFTPPEGKSFLV
jgi:hypothetical protein